jgi:di/tricarboxylate transporter
VCNIISSKYFWACLCLLNDVPKFAIQFFSLPKIQQLLTNELTHIVLLVAMAIIVVGLFVKRFKPTVVFSVVVLVLVVLGIIPLTDLLGHLANSSVITIFLLIFITASLKEHFNLLQLLDGIFKGIKSPRLFLLSYSGIVAGLSSVVNNTPVVALFIPYIYDWSKKRGFSPSKFLIPLSFAATLGGTITLIGTSTHLVLNGLMISNGFEPFAFTDFVIPGLLVTLPGLLYLVTIGYVILPEHQDLFDQLEDDQGNYIVEVKVAPRSKLISKTVEDGGLRNLDGVYLVEINRGGQVISPVAPNEIILEGDLLYFAGDTSCVSDLVKNEALGLVFAKTEKFNLGKELDLVEALVPAMSDLGSKRVKNTNFRERYDAAIVAIKRDGERLGGKIGDQELQYGDMLLLTAGKHFRERIKGAKNLYTLSYLDNLGDSKKREKRIFGLVLLGVIAAWSFGIFNMLLGLIILQGALLLLGLGSFDQLKRQFNPDLYLILISAIAFGTALIDTGTASWLTDYLFGYLEGASHTLIISTVFFATLILTSFVTNIAAVSIIFPVAAAFVPQLGVEPKELFLVVAFAASCSFLTPVSYQTNLMVYEPGGYKSIDFLKIGFPLTVLYALICITYFA